MIIVTAILTVIAILAGVVGLIGLTIGGVLGIGYFAFRIGLIAIPIVLAILILIIL